MAGVVREFGNQGARVGNYVADHINAPDYKNWYVLPFAITTILSYIIGTFFLPKWNSDLTMDVNVDSNCKENCKTRVKHIAGKWAYLAYLFIPLIIGLIVGGVTYKIGFSIKNPKAAAVGMGINFLRN